ncbi:hypothetical protein POX_b03137 [Penicillium oxalicum]|uniref:hypothetical protein n=1 Tax=Penicillium oxalicum TaxID=69781 RepID=UPI0020B71F1F|nr:hypothetical protein POX_b03137 [Penicillium oxalicum]KAI2793089.1 hypothetical protein POX_b03137 [Penicillium oxalicum]
MAAPYGRDRDVLAQPDHPHSPFGRARDVSYEFDLDNSNFPTPSKRNDPRTRPKFRTGTLAGAYRATSRASMSDDGAGLGLTASPRQHRDSNAARSPPFERFNNPDELLDSYRRTEYNGTGADYNPLDDWESPFDTRPMSHLTRLSPRVQDNEADGRAFSEASFGNEYSPRRRTSDYARDEQRLRRVTGKDSPVFSKAKVGARTALTADNLQRREEQEQIQISEEDDKDGPSLNLPRTWGSRAGHRSEWLRNVSASTTSEPQETKDEDMFAAPRYGSHNPPRGSFPSRSTLGKRTASLLSQDEIQDTKADRANGLESAPQDEGFQVPNTPVVVYKNSGFNKANAVARSTRDSQSLLRKLARTESPKPEQMQTPDQPKLFERRIYDKTPRVTGAWIDTPVPERVAEIPHELTKDIVRPSASSAPVGKSQSPVLEQKPSLQKQSEQKPDKQELLSAGNMQADEPKSDLGVTKEPLSTKEDSVPKTQATSIEQVKVSRPNLPKSGLQTVIEEMSSGKEGLDLGDDTIESLQAIMEDQTELKNEEAEEAAYEQEVLKRLELASSNGQGSVDIERLNDKLHSLAKNINEVKKGLNSLEEHVTRDATAVSRRGSSAKEDLVPPSLKSSADRTGPSVKNSRVYASFPLPRLWTISHHPERRRLTKLGWAILSILTWYIIELLMWDRYSHPLVAERCEGNCLQPDAPDLPFVTVSMLWRWSHLQSLLTPAVTILVAFFKLMAQLLGVWDGYVDEPPQLGNIVGEIRVNGTPVSFPWLTSPGQTVVPQRISTAHQPVWTPRDEPPRVEVQSPWVEDQVSMDEDEYL